MAVPTAAFLATAAPFQNYFSQYGKLGSYATSQGALPPPPELAGGSTAPLETVSLKVPINAGAGPPTNSWDTIDRFDYNLSDKTTMFFRYVGYNDVFFAGSNSLTLTMAITRLQRLQPGHPLQPEPRLHADLVLSGKVAYNRVNGAQPLGTAGIVPRLYLNQANTASSDASGLRIALPGYLPFSPGDAIPFGGPQNFYQFQPDLTWTKGAHSLHFGGTYVQLRDNRTFGAYENATSRSPRPAPTRQPPCWRCRPAPRINLTWPFTPRANFPAITTLQPVIRSKPPLAP